MTGMKRGVKNGCPDFVINGVLDTTQGAVPRCGRHQVRCLSSMGHLERRVIWNTKFRVEFLCIELDL